MTCSTEYLKSVLNSTNQLAETIKMNQHFPCVPFYSELQKRFAEKLLEKDKLTTALPHLIEAHGVGLRHTALNAQRDKAFKKKNIKNSSESSSSGSPVPNYLCNDYEKYLTFGTKENHFQSRNIPAEWTTVQITEIWPSSACTRMLGFGPPSQVCNLPKLVITRFACNPLHKPTVKIIEKPTGNVGCGSLLTELNSILEGNRSVNKDFRGNRDQYWKMKQEHHDQLKVLVDSLENWWLDYCKCLLVGEPTDPSDVATLTSLVTGATIVVQQAKRIPTDDEKTLLRLLLSSYCYLNSQQIVRGLMCIFGVKAKNPVISELLSFFRSSQIDLQKLKSAKRNPIILILDKTIQQLPWESMTSLSTTPISRLPSLHFLNFLSLKSSERCKKTPQRKNIHSDTDMVVMNPRHAYYLVNPGQDLPGVQQRLQPILEDIWGKDCGLSGSVPMEQHIKQSLTERDLFLYCGHGSGSKYLPNDHLIKLDCRAIPILMGCCSGQLNAQGRIVDPTGAAVYYLIAGSPGMVGMLWEVTDVDCDRFTVRLLDLLVGARQNKIPHSIEHNQKNVKQNKSDLPSPPDRLEPEILRAVSASRPVTKNFLTGAAAVVYGLPIRALNVDNC